MNIQVEVTAEDWKIGIQRSPSNCPFAKAIKRSLLSLKDQAITVTYITVGMTPPFAEGKVTVWKSLPSWVSVTEEGELVLQPIVQRPMDWHLQRLQDCISFEGRLDAPQVKAIVDFDRGLVASNDCKPMSFSLELSEVK